MYRTNVPDFVSGFGRQDPVFFSSRAGRRTCARYIVVGATTTDNFFIMVPRITAQLSGKSGTKEVPEVFW